MGWLDYRENYLIDASLVMFHFSVVCPVENSWARHCHENQEGTANGLSSLI
jgi:hypothetical protein